MRIIISTLLAICLELNAHACLWDSDTLAQEKRKSPDMAKVILGQASEPIDINALKQRIMRLTADRHEEKAEWWNDLAGAHIRLGQLNEAIAMLEPLTSRFPNDYGIHANLGTAYHLTGRYLAAEKEIARDLEINPDAHFGLEKYHLALLQYLIRDSKYQERHVYVDEFSPGFQGAEGPIMRYNPVSQTDNTGTNTTANEELRAQYEQEYREALENKDSGWKLNNILETLSFFDDRPEYRKKWDLGSDPKLQDGVIYMATLNPRQPACFVMLGVVAWKNRDLNLAAASFEKAIDLHSPQSDILKRKVTSLRSHIEEARGQGKGAVGTILLFAVVFAIGVLFVIRIILRGIRTGSPLSK